MKDRGRSLFLSDGVIELARTHEEIKGAFLTLQKDADQIYPGWKEKLSYTGESTAQAASSDWTRQDFEYHTVLGSASWWYRETAFAVVGEILEELSTRIAGGGACGHRDGPPPGAVSCRPGEDARKARKPGQYGNTGLGVGVVESAMTHEEIKGALSTFQKDADQTYPGWKEKLPYTDEFPVQAASSDKAYIDEGCGMLCYFLPLAVGNNQGRGDVECDKNYDFYTPPAKVNPEVTRGMRAATKVPEHGDTQLLLTNSYSLFDRGRAGDLGEMISQLSDGGVPVPGGLPRRTTSHAYKEFLDKGGISQFINDKLVEETIQEDVDKLVKVGTETHDQITDLPLVIPRRSEVGVSAPGGFSTTSKEFLDKGGINEITNDKLVDKSIQEDVDKPATVGTEVRDKVPDSPLMISKLADVGVSAPGGFSTTSYACKKFPDKGDINELINDKLVGESIQEDADKLVKVGMGIRDEVPDPPLMISQLADEGVPATGGFSTASHAYKKFLDKGGVNEFIHDELADESTYEALLGKDGVNAITNDKLADTSIHEDVDKSMKVSTEIRDYVPDPPLMIFQLVDVGVPTLGGFRTTSHAYNEFPDKCGMETIRNYDALAADTKTFVDVRGMGYPSSEEFVKFVLNNATSMHPETFLTYDTTDAYTKAVQAMRAAIRETGKGKLVSANTTADEPNEMIGMKQTTPIIYGGMNVLYQPSLFENMGHFHAILATRGEAAHFAAETPMGTNANVCTKDDSLVDALVYYIDPDSEGTKTAFPNLLFDKFDHNFIDGRGMMCSFLTPAVSINQGMGDVEYGKIYNSYLPPAFPRLYDGPVVNVVDIWRILGKGTQNGGLEANTIIKPKRGLQPKPFGGACCVSWQCGDFSKNDEPQDNQVFCQRNECFPEVVTAMRVTIKETGNGKLLSANITAEVPNDARGKYCLSQPGPLLENCAFLVDGYEAGCTAVTSVTRNFPKQFLHYHLAGHGSGTSTQTQRGYTAFVYTMSSRVIGASGIHTGTMSLGQMEGDASDMHIAFMLQAAEVDGPYYRQDWEGMKQTTPIISGGTNTLRLPVFFENLGY